MGLLDGHRAVITGGASGIGFATAKRFIDEGAVVALLDINAESLGKAAAELGCAHYVVDVSDADAVEAAYSAAADALGGLTLCFNNAGVGDQVKLHAMSPQRWRQITSVCLDGVFHGIRSAVPLIRASGGGAIVNTASISGVRPASGEGAYAAAKAGVAALTATAALEYAPEIRVNAVAPGMIHTTLTDPLLGLEGTTEFMRDKTPLGRIGTPEDIADVVVFLCSPLARFVTGQNIVIDGGMTLHGAGVDGLFDLVTTMFGRPPEEL
jgi:NAD(P)-dependent dehydrogenase (short-subunit alcohol dehydrogenase family)